MCRAYGQIFITSTNRRNNNQNAAACRMLHAEIIALPGRERIAAHRVCQFKDVQPCNAFLTVCCVQIGAGGHKLPSPWLPVDDLLKEADRAADGEAETLSGQQGGWGS